MTAGAPLRRLAACCVAVVLAATAVGCADSAPPQSETVAAAPGELLGEPIATHGYPSLESVVSRSLKIRYRSTSGLDGSATSGSGVVFVPKGDPPPGGWVVASVAHATTGARAECAPSDFPGLLGSLPEAVVALSEKYLVVVSDYQGLGSPGVHPYLEPETAAYNVIDAVRAARHAVPDVSERWIAFGQSQGGQAVWAANEIADEYGAGLDLAAVVAASPATDLRPMGDAVVDGDLSTDQIVLWPLLLHGLHAAHPEVDPFDYLHGGLADRRDVFLTCNDRNQELKGILARAADPADYRPSGDDAVRRLREALAADSLPRRRTSAPMLVAYGSDDPILRPAWTASAVRQGCALGDEIEAIEMHGQGHMLSISEDAITWLADRLAGRPMSGTCRVGE